VCACGIEKPVNYNDAMSLLRYLYLLALAIWLGGLIALRIVAGADAAFAEMLRRFQYVAFTCGGVMLLALGSMAALGPRPARFAVRVVIAGAMLAAAIVSGWWSSRRLAPTSLMLASVAGGLALLYFEARSE
jgi:hypothetical protein